MAAAPSAQDVADALAMTLEREDPSGAPWCPPGDGIALRRWVTDRSASLGTGIRRAVRLARLIALVDGRDYVRFLYVRLPALRTRHFRAAIEAAVADGTITRSLATLFDSGVHLREPALTSQGRPDEVFEIDFNQMPRLAALLDFLHNALGFTLVADMLAPLLQRKQSTDHADEVSRKLQSALNAWLSDRLESANHMLQAKRIRAFLASRGRVAPEAIDDEGIISFWTMLTEATEDERVDGFRLYRSTASAMLRYRSALRDATTAEHLEKAIVRGLDPANDNLSISDNETGFSTTLESWRSPLRALALPPANLVKWFTRREQHELLNYMGGPSDDDEAEEDSADEDESGSWKEGLAGDERFDLAFWLTLLRTDIFGAVQASIVARLRKRARGSDAIARAMAEVDDTAYTTAATAYEGLRRQIHLESLAALAVLMEAGTEEAILLLHGLGGRQAVTSVVGSIADDEMLAVGDATAAERIAETIAPRLRTAIADPNAAVPEGPGRSLLMEALAATRKVSRAGFRREDRADKEMMAALRSGAAAVFQVVGELDRLMAVLRQRIAGADIAGDRARFQAAFERIYLSPSDE